MKTWLSIREIKCKATEKGSKARPSMTALEYTPCMQSSTEAGYYRYCSKHVVNQQAKEVSE